MFGIGHTISLPKKDIEPIKNISYNNIKVKIPTNPKNILNIIYPNNNLDLIVIKRHIDSIDKENEKEIINFNKLDLTVNDKDIILITKIFNNFVNKYYEIINSNETIKKIINTK
jgi:hypothetical protein